MERTTLIGAMKRSISEVLETMCFLPVDDTGPVETDVFYNSLENEISLAKIDFNGSFSGFIMLLLPDELALFIAGSFLGRVADSVSPEHVSETKKEIVNMIAGNTFAILDDQQVFDLGIPEVLDPDPLMISSDNLQEIVLQANTLENTLFVKLSII